MDPRSMTMGGKATSLTFARICAYALLLLSSVTAVLTDSDLAQPGAMLTFENMDSAIDAITEIVIADDSRKDFLIKIDDKISEIEDFELGFPEVSKRGWNRRTAPLAGKWTEYETINQGTWLAAWQPASCVHQNEHGSTPVTVSLTLSSKHGASFHQDFNKNYGTAASMSIGYETTEENSQSTIRVYTIPAHSYGQVWRQQLMVWQDQRRRKCTKHSYQKDGIKCGRWSEPMHGDLPVKNGMSFGWSTGKDKMDFSSCGGGN
ncbi:hypothetical protein OXX80_003973 [Metschnikowia pulcherrima]